MVKMASTRFLGNDICSSNSEIFGWHREPTAEELLGGSEGIVKAKSLTKQRRKKKIRRSARKFW